MTIPDYTPPEGWRVVKHADVPVGVEYREHGNRDGILRSHCIGEDRPVLVRVDPPFDFGMWIGDVYFRNGVDGQWVCRWDRIEPVAEHVELRQHNGEWRPASSWGERVPADAVFEVRPKETSDG